MVTVSTTVPDPLGKYGKDFDKLGRHFCAFNKIWVRPSHLCKPYPEDLREVGPRHAACYTNDKTKQDGVVAELYKFVPEDFHMYLESSPFFAKQVCAVVVPQAMLQLLVFLLVPPWWQGDEGVYHQPCPKKCIKYLCHQ